MVTTLGRPELCVQLSLYDRRITKGKIVADWDLSKWTLHILRGTEHNADEEVHELDGPPERYERGGHVEWYGVAAGEDFFLEYDQDEIMASFVHAPLTEEERKQGGLIIRQTNFYDQ